MTQNFNLPQANIQDFQSKLNVYSDRSRDYWKMLVGLHGTILGLSVALVAHSGEIPTAIMLIAWGLQLFTLGLGLFIIYINNEQNLDEALLNYRFSMNTSEINRLKEEGTLVEGNEKYEGLILAAIYEKTPDSSHSIFTECALKLIEKYKGELPANKYTSLRKKGRLRNYIDNKWRWCLKLFYWSTFTVFLLFFIALVFVGVK